MRTPLPPGVEKLYGHSALRLIAEAWCGVNPGVDDAELGTYLDELITTHPEECYVLRARGQSMERARIFDGDYIVFRCGCRVREGRPVVAMVDGELVVKLYRRGLLWSCPAGLADCAILGSTELIGTVEAIVARWEGLDAVEWNA